MLDRRPTIGMRPNVPIDLFVRQRCHRSGDIAEVLGKSINTVAPVRAKLIEKGMVFSPAHGDTAFTVPLFDGFMRRTMPALELPPTT